MTFDFIVVGSGMAGASVAFELAQTRRVCLIEAEAAPGFHSTGRSAALFAPSYGGPVIRAMTRASRSFFDHPPPGFTEHALLQQRGCLYIARADQCSRLSAMNQEIRDSGGQIEFISVAEAVGHVPLLRPGYVAAAAFDPDAMDIDVHSLHQGFLRGTRAAGATLFANARVDALERRNGLWQFELEGQRIAAPVVINAAGAWADEFAERCGAKPVGLQPLRRTAMLVDPPADITVQQWPAVIDADEEFYFKPDAGKLLLSPADETPTSPTDAQPDEYDVALGVDRVQASLLLEVRRIAHKWAGLRTFARDRVPVVGFDPHIPGFFWCAGQGGYGIQTAPALSRVAASLAQGGRLPGDVAGQGVGCDDIAPGRLL